MRFGMILLIIITVLASGLILAQNQTLIKQVPIKQSSPVSGQQMFATYCAVCHGATGKGDGPAVAALKKSPGDLTKLAMNNHGKFPEDRVVVTIAGQTGIAAHGSADMPIWGDLFKSIGSDASLTKLRISNLTGYVKSIQSK